MVGMLWQYGWRRGYGRLKIKQNALSYFRITTTRSGFFLIDHIANFGLDEFASRQNALWSLNHNHNAKFRSLVILQFQNAFWPLFLDH